jgi:tetratricopeptide (TPR) repeat protein
MAKTLIITAIAVFAALFILGTTYVPGGKAAIVEGEGDLVLLRSGIHFRPRWQKRALYPVEPSQIPVEVVARTVEGEVRTDIRVTISIDEGDLPRLHRTYAGRYVEKLLAPLVEDAVVRSGALEREELAGNIVSSVRPVLKTFGIHLHSADVASLEVVVSDEDRCISELAGKHGSKVVLLGIDAMDWEIYEQVRQDVPMPNIERLKAEGATGDLLSMDPPVSPMIWTTMATGVDPDVHGIIDFLMKDPRTGEDVPITSNMRKVPAIWNITTRFGLSSGFIGWLGSYPAEPVRGFQVSDRIVFHTFDPRWRKGEGTDEPPRSLAGLTYPESLIGELRTLILTYEEVRYETMRHYVRIDPDEMPHGAQTFDPLDPVVNLAHIIASSTTYENIAARTYEKYRPDILAVYLDMVDAVCHVFIKHMKPHTADVTPEEAHRYGAAVAATYSHTDSLIGKWLSRIDDETTLIVVSDHGFKHGDLRPSGPSAVGGGQAVKWHRMVGAIALYGNHVKPGATIYGASVRDVCPTALRLLGLPVAEDMSGEVLTEAFDEEWLAAASEVGTVKTYGLRRVPGAIVRREEEEDAILKRLQALGYISGGETGEVTDYSKLARSYFTKAEFDKAIDIWQAILEEQPDNVDVMTSIADAQIHKGDLRAAEETARRAMAIDPEFYPAHNMLTLCYINTGRLSDAEQLASFVVARDPGNSEAYFNLGVVYDIMGLDSRALASFEKAVGLRGDYDESRINLGNAYLKAGRVAEAREQLEAALNLNPESADAWYLLGHTYRTENDTARALESYEEALRCVPAFNPARISIAVIHVAGGNLTVARRVLEEAVRYGKDLPQVYTNLGIVLMKMGEHEQAETHFEKAIEAGPDYMPARLNLARLYLAQGRHDRAREQAERVLRSDPADPQARALLESIR